MDFMLFERLCANWLKCPKPDVEGHVRDFDAALRERFKNRRREMQPRGWGRYRISLPGINGLVTLAIERFVRALDIRRKRNVTEPIERLMQTVLRFEPQHTQAVFGASFHPGLQFTFAEHNSLTHRNLTSRPHKRFPGVGRELANQQHLDRRHEEFVARGTFRSRRFSA